MILVIDMNWKKDSLAFQEFVSPIIAAVAEIKPFTVKHYTEINPNNLENYTKVVLSGVALKDNSAINHLENFSWLKDFNKPVLGICAGMQLIGKLFGSPLKPCLEIGMTQIITLKENPFFAETFQAYSLHNYCVEPSADFEVLAKSAQCFQAIKHIKKPLYGLLFHPEVRNPEILKRFIKMEQ